MVLGKRRKRPGDGPYCDRLCQRLEDAGAERVLLMLAQGYWSHRHQDVMRWTAQGIAKERNAWGVRAGETVMFGSWDAVKDCARHGIDFYPDDVYGSFDVYAKERSNA